jgi:hypothetical protein
MVVPPIPAIGSLPEPARNSVIAITFWRFSWDAARGELGLCDCLKKEGRLSAVLSLEVKRSSE